MDVPGGGPCKHRTTAGAFRFGDHARFLSLVAQKIAECRELPTVASVFPTLWFRSEANHPDLLLIGI
jgi:hypothetical protein